MSGEHYKARRDVVIAGIAYAEGKTFEADPDSARVAVARGWIEVAQAKAKATQSKRSPKEAGN